MGAKPGCLAGLVLAGNGKEKDIGFPNEAEDVKLLIKWTLRVFTNPGLNLWTITTQQHGNTGNGKDKLSYTTTTLIYITTTDKHGVPPTKRLFRVAMLDPSQGFIDPWGKFGDLELPSVVRSLQSNA
ncbi:hypothetical protein Tco_1143138 [Tanacetum coccineum]